MGFTKEQADEIKKQLLMQVENLPNENKDEIKEQILSLNEEGLEIFLKQNNIQIGGEGDVDEGESGGEGSKGGKSVFQSIVEGEIPSYKIDEVSKAIAILEINPLSLGHVIILPKKQGGVEEISKNALSLAQKIAKKIKSKFKPTEIKIESASFQGYGFINVIPIYKDKPVKKYKASEKELKEVQSKLRAQKRSGRVRVEKVKKSSDNLPVIKFRIP